jgi:hypothetical protein
MAQERVPISRPMPMWSHAPFVPTGPVTHVHNPTTRRGGTTIGLSFDGIDFILGNCGCLPPDTNAAVGHNFIVETVNFHIRAWFKDTGVPTSLDEDLSVFFGQASQGDPYMVFDELADRWYVNAFNADASGLILAVSQTNDPTGAWFIYNLNNVGGFPDFAKPGYNKDAIFISYNDFGTHGGNAAVATIDKAQAIAGILVDFISNPPPQFRAMPPAQFHGDTTGGVEWFGSINFSGGNTVRITKMTN